MTRVLQIRFGLIFFIIFMAYYFDYFHLEFRWYQEHGGICEQWINDDPRLGCSKGSGINIVNKLFFKEIAMFLPTSPVSPHGPLAVWGFELGSFNCLTSAGEWLVLP